MFNVGFCYKLHCFSLGKRDNIKQSAKYLKKNMAIGSFLTIILTARIYYIIGKL